MKLAINGGKPVRSKPFPDQTNMTGNHITAAKEVLEKNILSAYRGNWIPAFWGGEKIKELEKDFAQALGAEYALAVNSCTSALITACGAIGLEPGDEVIVTPWSMSCSATAPMIYGAVPVFVDIEPDNFCIDPKKIEEKITPKTKAIIVVSLFGQPYDPEINKIAKKYDLVVIEDAAQSIGSYLKSKNTLTELDMPIYFQGDIACYSFTQGKHMTSGEGGMIVTYNSDFALKCSLIRNHAEAVIHAMPDHYIEAFDLTKNMVGFNFRMTEIQAAILSVELNNFIGEDEFVEPAIMLRRRQAKEIYQGLLNLEFIKNSGTRKDCHHSYYVQPFLYDEDLADNIPRDIFINAVKAELKGEKSRPDRPMIGAGYITPLYKMPLFTDKLHWSFKDYNFEDYGSLNLRTVEKLQSKKFFLSLYHGLPLTSQDMSDIISAFYKVWENREELRKGYKYYEYE